MAKKDYEVINDAIPSMATPWVDEKAGTCYGGRPIEAFLKERLSELSAGKIGAFHLVDGSDGMATLYGFADDDAKESWEHGGNPTADNPLVLAHVSFYSRPVQNEYTLSVRVTKTLDATMVKDAPNTLRFTYSSYYGGDPTDTDTQAGYARFTVNGIHVEALDMTLSEHGREYEADLGRYMSQETNTVVLTVGNAHGKSRSWSWTVRAVELVAALDAGYDESVLRDRNWTLRVSVNGLPAVTRVLVDGAVAATSVINNSSYDFRIDPTGELAAGAHSIEVYAENAELGIRSNTVRTAFIKRGSAGTSVCIGGKADTSAMLYSTAVVPYFFHVPTKAAGQEVEARFEVRDAYGNWIADGGRQMVTLDGDSASGAQVWRYALLDNQFRELGEIRMAVIVEGVEAEHTLSVTDPGVTLEEASECKVLLSPRGKTNADADAEVWQSVYEGSVTATVERSGNFHLTEGNGFGDDMYAVRLGKRITLAGLLPFAQDFGSAGNRQGKTFEFEFETRNCINFSAKVIECMDNGTGFVVYADHAELWCDNKMVRTLYSDERRMRIGFVIEGSTRECVNKTIDKDGNIEETRTNRDICYIYVNGVIVRIMDYGDGDTVSSWKQRNPQDIVIGSDECDIYLSVIRIYDKALNYRQMIGNFSYDTPLPEDKLAIARRNDVLDSNAEVDFAKVRTALPKTPSCVWELERMPLGKKDYVNTNTYFENPQWDAETGGNACAPFDCIGGKTALDGTSSLSYPDPYKNWAARYSDGTWTIHLGETDLVITDYSITSGLETGETEFVHKVNFASSEGIGNIMCMNAYQDILLKCAATYPSLLTPPQQEQLARGERVTFRQSLSGFPETGWIRSTAGGVGKTTFLSLFNFINNKYSPSMFGLDNSGAAEIWEINDNNNFFTEHLEPGEWTTKTVTENGEEKEQSSWECDATTIYYARVPKKSPVTGADYGTAKNAGTVSQANAENGKLRDFHNFIVDCNPNLAERYRKEHGQYRLLDGVVTYGDQQFNRDTPAYRRAKFNAEYSAHGICKESLLFYFLFFVWNLGVDSMDKNASIAFIMGLIYAFVRDSDTIGRFDNIGKLMFQFWHEWNDSYDLVTGRTGTITGEEKTEEGWKPVCTAGVPVFNGRLSGLWDLVSQCWPKELGDMYSTMRAAGLNADGMMRLYDSFWSQWCESLYNVDGMGYANTGRFDMAHGDKRESFRQFFKFRERYMDGKYGVSTKPVVFRVTDSGTGSGTGITLRYSCPMYGSINWGSGDIQTQRQLTAGAPVRFNRIGGAMNDVTVTVYNADLLTEISSYSMQGGEAHEGGMQEIGQIRFAEGVENCKKLRRIILDYPYESPNGVDAGNTLGLVKASVALEEAVIRNYPALSGTCTVSSDVIRKVDLRGTNVSRVVLPEFCAIEELYLPDSTTAIVLRNVPNLTTLDTGSMRSLRTFSITGETQIDVMGIVDRLYAMDADCEIVLEDVAIAGMTTKKLLWLAEHGRLTGSVTMADAASGGHINLADKIALVKAFGDIDTGAGGLEVAYSKVAMTGVRISVPLTMHEAGRSYQLGLTAVPVTANNVAVRQDGSLDVEWSLPASASSLATVDSSGWTVNVRSVQPVDSPDLYALSVKVRRMNDGAVLEDSLNVRFSRRSPHLGDFAYADGTFADEYVEGLGVVGIVYMAERKATEVVAGICPLDVANATGDPALHSQYWGVYESAPFNNSEVKKAIIAAAPDAYDITGIGNISSYGFSDVSQVVTENTNAGTFSTPPTSTCAACFDGKKNTGLIVNTAKQLYTNYLMPIPEIAAEIGSEFPDSWGSWTDEDGTVHDGVAAVAGKVSSMFGYVTYNMLFFTPATYCYLYEPSMPEGVTLHEQYRKHNWYLPDSGELMRLMYYCKRGTQESSDDASIEDGKPACPIFARAAKKAGKQLVSFANNWWWSSREFYGYTALTVYTGGNVDSGNKNNQISCRPVAAFHFEL